jgi:hypothetical protein
MAFLLQADFHLKDQKDISMNADEHADSDDPPFLGLLFCTGIIIVFGTSYNCPHHIGGDCHSGAPSRCVAFSLFILKDEYDYRFQVTAVYRMMIKVI